ncbi:MAG: hypothetical protein JEZ14_06045 [Marinilabiliaceae bacterium]|nr:hypothetical protein [Marinilabiliaceae bacterium]
MTPEEKNTLHKFEALKENQSFKVPERYFETFDERMQELVKRHDTPKRQLIIQMIKPWATVAALFTLIAILYNVFTPFQSQGDQLTVFSETEELFSPVLFELTEYDLVTYVVDEDISFSTDELLDEDLGDISQNEIDDLILF